MTDTILFLTLLVQVAILLAIKRSTHTQTMNQAELAQRLGELGAQLTKALDEIRLAIENAGQTTPEVDAALDNARAVAQALDDLNPDQPPPPPEP